MSASLSISTFKTLLSVCGSLSRCASTFTHLIWRRGSFLDTALISLSKSALDPACMWRVANLWLNHFWTPDSAVELSHPAVIRPLAQPLVTRSMAARHARMPLSSHRVEAFSSGLQSTGAPPFTISSKLSCPVLIASMQPVDPQPSRSDQSDAITTLFFFLSALSNLMVWAASAHLQRPISF